jgi:transposase
MSVAPCKRVELSRLRWRRRQSLANTLEPTKTKLVEFGRFAQKHEHRRIYRREGNGYPRDLKDAEWGAAGAADDMKGFVVLPRRWVVERTFSWFGRNRRLAKDFEYLAETLATFVTLASIQLALRRLARA